ncbi:cobalamin B12-binding protein [Novosphingobium sp. AAP83]|nr:cobalamin B12-binding protein [Novosphingobium sp. AAP83]
MIPRLLMAHSLDGPPQIPDSVQTIDPEDAANFASLPLALEADELLTVVEAYLARGVAVESIYVDLLAPSARKLGELWEEDGCDFLDVSMGLWRLQEVMREIAICFPSTVGPKDPARSALFLSMPGDDHSFGALMIEEVFARNGWQTDVLIEPRRKELLQIVAEQHFDLVGLTISSDCPTGALKELISAIRSVSRSPKTKIFIGGRMVNDDPGIVAAVDADGTAPDACSFLALAELKITGSGRLDLSFA